MEVNREKAVMEAAIQAGHLLLENGAEISRVEETMERSGEGCNCNRFGNCRYI